MNIFYGVIITGLEDIEGKKRKVVESSIYSVTILDNATFKVSTWKNSESE